MVEPLTYYSPHTQTYYVPPPHLEPSPLSFHTFPLPMSYQPPSTNIPSIINFPPLSTQSYNSVLYHYEEGEGESHMGLSANEVANLIGLITLSGRVMEPAITNLCQDFAQGKGKAGLGSEKKKQQQEEEQELIE